MAAAFFLVFDFPLDFALLDFENHSLFVSGCVYQGVCIRVYQGVCIRVCVSGCVYQGVCIRVCACIVGEDNVKTCEKDR